MMLTMYSSYGHVKMVLCCAELSVAEEWEGRIAQNPNGQLFSVAHVLYTTAYLYLYLPVSEVQL